jgi:hypothetical protein
MKRLVILAVFLLIISVPAIAQQYAYTSTNLNQIGNTMYASAEVEIDYNTAYYYSLEMWAAFEQNCSYFDCYDNINMVSGGWRYGTSYASFSASTSVTSVIPYTIYVSPSLITYYEIWVPCYYYPECGYYEYVDYYGYYFAPAYTPWTPDYFAIPPMYCYYSYYIALLQDTAYSVAAGCEYPTDETSTFLDYDSKPTGCGPGDSQPCYGGTFDARLKQNGQYPPDHKFEGRTIQEYLENTPYGDSCQQLNAGPYELTLPPENTWSEWTVDSQNRYATSGGPYPGPDLIAAYYDWIDYYMWHSQVGACDVFWEQDLAISACTPGAIPFQYESHYLGIYVDPNNVLFYVSRDGVTSNPPHQWPW